MNRTLPSLLLALLLFTAACQGDATAPRGGADSTGAENTGAMQGAPPAAVTAPAVAEMEGGVQVVRIEAGLSGYEPQAVQLRPGVPARLIFTRTVESECMEQVQIPSFGVGKTDLPLNEPVPIEFTPGEGGEFTFACGMDMMSGTIVVKS